MLRSLESSDASVQGTNDDAQVSKLSCAKAGYFRDEFIQLFVRRASRRSPLINRGYYSRHAALRQLLESFLTAAEASGQQPQVLVLGAGFDTSWFQLSRDKGRVPYKCLEVDFKEVTQRKASIIAKESALHALLTAPSVSHAPTTDAAPAPLPGPAGESGSSASGGAGAAASTSTATPSRPGDTPTDVTTAGLALDGTAAALPAATAASGPDVQAAARAPLAITSASASEPASASKPASASEPASPSKPASRPGLGSGLVPGPAAGSPRVGVDLNPSGGRLLSPHYTLLPVDLRHVEALEAAVRLAGLDFSAPTYVLSECVLVYMEPQYSNAVARWVAQAFPNAVMAVYEQIRPDDAFGRQMVSNLEMRGCPLRGLSSTPTLEAHCKRLTDAGWSWADAQDMDTLYRTFIDANERLRVERLELFDELEEWHMIQEHYCIAIGCNDVDGWLSSVGFGTQPSKGGMQ